MKLHLNRNDKMKSSKQLEKHFKGISNHKRIDTIFFIFQNPGCTLDQICESQNGNYKTFSTHVGKLLLAGLLEKRNKGTTIEYYLSSYGKTFYNFIFDFAVS